MKNILKLSRKFLVLGAMLFALGFVTFTDFGTAPTGASLFCCSECEPIYQNCIDGGGTPTQCNQQANYCWRHCDFGC
ncbi:MAG TPA: hypothetical protein VF604_14410 [Pyrinomonadaceae bacterium]